VPYVVGDPIAEAAIKRLNPEGAESMSAFTGAKHRTEGSKVKARIELGRDD
jgi:hypothetical protein